MVKAVRFERFGAIEDVVLVAQFVGDVLERLIEVLNLEREKGLSAGFAWEQRRDRLHRCGGIKRSDRTFSGVMWKTCG